jgi:predicted CoA-binding protein
VNTRQDIQGFLSQKTLAIAGLSRDPKSFSANVARELKGKGYRLFPVNPNASEIGGEKCYPSVSALPEKVGGALFFTPPAATEKAVREAVNAGVDRIWIQQGAQSPAVLAFCREKGLPAVTGHCVLMFAEPVASIHSIHRWVKKLFGGIPK